MSAHLDIGGYWASPSRSQVWTLGRNSLLAVKIGAAVKLIVQTQECTCSGLAGIFRL